MSEHQPDSPRHSWTMTPPRSVCAQMWAQCPSMFFLHGLPQSHHLHELTLPSRHTSQPRPHNRPRIAGEEESSPCMSPRPMRCSQVWATACLILGISEQSLRHAVFVHRCGPDVLRCFFCSDCRSRSTCTNKRCQVDTRANRGHTTGHASPERRNLAPACLHAP